MHRLATWVCLVATLLMGAAPSRGLVLCVGENGHVALEASSTDASCFDCPGESEVDNGCCSDPRMGDAGCTCTDLLLLASEKQPVRSLVSDRVDRIPPACLVAQPETDVTAPLARGFELRARTQSPPCPRVPTTLILRV